MSPKEVAEATIVLNKPITINQSWNNYINKFLVEYKNIFTIKVKAQKTITRWTEIMVAQQYIWHIQVEIEFQFLHDNNTCNLIDGCIFGEVFKYYVIGDDETCYISL